MLRFLSQDGGKQDERACLSNTGAERARAHEAAATEREARVWSAALGPAAGRGRYGVSGTGRFCFKVSRRDRTPRFTLLVTLRVTESAGGGGGRTFWEGGLATKHF